MPYRQVVCAQLGTLKNCREWRRLWLMISFQLLTNWWRTTFSWISLMLINTLSVCRTRIHCWEMRQKMGDLILSIWTPMDRWFLFLMLRSLLCVKEECCASHVRILEFCVVLTFRNVFTTTGRWGRRCMTSTRYQMIYSECAENTALYGQFSSKSALQVHWTSAEHPNWLLCEGVHTVTSGEERVWRERGKDWQYL